MKWILIVVIFLVCSFLGYSFSIKYKKRMAFYSALIFLAQKLDVEINFSRERLIKLIESCNEKTRLNLLGVDRAFVLYLTQGGELTCEKLFQKNSPFKKEEQEIVTMFFRSLGRSDVENQTKEIKNALSRFEKCLTDATIDYKKNGSLGTKLGIVVGLVIAVVLI